MINFDEDRSYEFDFGKTNIDLMYEGLLLYRDYLYPYAKEGNEKILKEARWITSTLNQLSGLQNRAKASGDFQELNLLGKNFIKIKSTLVHVQAKLMNERERLLKNGAPPTATEYLEKRLASLKDMLEGDNDFASIPTHEIMPAPKTNTGTTNKLASHSTYASKSYVTQEIISEFEAKNDGFDYTKLLTLINELNDNWNKEQAYSVAATLRAIIDHIPPLLNKKSFEDLFNSYAWSRTDKSYMKQLLSFRAIADDALHRMINRTRLNQINVNDIPPNRALEILLTECINFSR